MKGQKLYSNFMGLGSMTQEQLETHLSEVIKINKQTATLDSDDKVTMRELLVALADEVGTLNDIAKLPPEQKEGVYSLGYQAYNQGNYEQAIHFFRLLYMLDPLNERNLFALGLALEKSNQYFEALTAYMACSYLESENPVFYFRSGICFIELGEESSAYHMYGLTQKHCKGKKEFAVLFERAKLFSEGIRKKLTAKSKKKKKKA